MHTSSVFRARIIVATLVAAASACGSGAGPSYGPGSPYAAVPGARPRGPFDPQRFDTDVPGARADLRDVDGRAVGTVRFAQAPYGVVMTVELSGLPAGVHAMHVHAVGRCEPPFTTAGGHYNPASRQHGVRNPAGFHAGDLPNVVASVGASVRVEAISRDVTLDRGPASLFTPEGTALVIHRDADDYTTDPSGGAGARIACGVIVPDSGTRLSPSAFPRR
jgi:Cu-Zn family superoxide dismutase